jgi:hypothetical protein
MYFFLCRRDKHRLKMKIIWGCHAVPFGKYLQMFRSITAPNAFVFAVKPFLGWLVLKVKALGSIILRNFGKYCRSVTTYPHNNTAGKTSYIANIEVHYLLNFSYVPNPLQRKFCRRYVSNLLTNSLSYFYILLRAVTVSIPMPVSTLPSPMLRFLSPKWRLFFVARRKCFFKYYKSIILDRSFI